MTLIELLVTMAVGLIAMGVTLELMISAMRAGDRVGDRTEVVQRGRTAMEQITQRLRSSTCLATNSPAITAGDASSVTFYSSLGEDNPSFRPERRRMTFTNGSVVEEIWEPTGSWPALSYASSPTRTRTMITNVTPAGTSPYFRYNAFTASDPITPSEVLAVPLSAADRTRVVQVEVAFRVQPTSRNAPPPSIIDSTFATHVYMRTADPTDPLHSPACI